MLDIALPERLRAEAMYALYHDDIGRLHTVLNSLPPIQQYETAKEWDLLSLVGLAFHCDKGRRIVECVLDQQLHDLIASFAIDAAAFMDKMTQCGVVLSGGHALRFVDRQAMWTAGDFDFYCPSAGFGEFCTYIESLDEAARDEGVAEGAELAAPYGEGGYTARHRYKVSTSRLDVIRSATPSALFPLTFFHSTLLMNAISPTFIYIAYPSHVIDRCGVASRYGRASIVAVTAIEKYETRGYQILPYKSSLAKSMDMGRCKDRLRFFGDSTCLTIKFGCRGSIHRARNSAQFGKADWSAGWVLGSIWCGSRQCEVCNMSCPFSVLVHA